MQLVTPCLFTRSDSRANIASAPNAAELRDHHGLASARAFALHSVLHLAGNEHVGQMAAVVAVVDRCFG